MSEVTVTRQKPDRLRRLLERKSAAVLFMLACFAGASLVGVHWAETPWAVRKAELGGLSEFSQLPTELARRCLRPSRLAVLRA